jgi:hypothetical protein
MNAYINKLKKALDLILNDVPDNRDDTINSKLIDSLKSKLECSSSPEETSPLIEFLGQYLNEQIITSNSSYSDSKLADKDFDVIAFFIDLIQVYLRSLFKHKSQREPELFHFKNKLLKYIQSFFELKQHSEIDSCECSSLFGLIELIYDVCSELNSSKQALNAENNKILNEIILDTHLLGDESMLIYLNPDYKSLFVRKSYKSILKKHMIHLVQEISLGSEPSSELQAARLDKICSLVAAMPFEIKLNNYDLYVDILRHFLFELCALEGSNNNSDTTRLLDALVKLHSSLNFKQDKSKFLVDFSHLVSEASMESFSYLLAFDLMFSFIRIDPAKNSACVSEDYARTPLLFYQTFLKQLNNISNHFITAQLVEPAEASQSDKSLAFSLNISSKCKKSTDLLFKFHIYLYSFLNEMSSNDKPHLNATGPLLSRIYELLSMSSTSDPLISIRTQITLLKYKICELLTVPFHLELNKRLQVKV